MKKSFLPTFVLLLMLSCQQPPETVQQGDITFLPMATKRLPDLNEARGSHALVWAGDHILAIGGHTTGFVPTATAEYYKGGRWHKIPTIYPHDTPFALVLKNGDVLMGGGYESSFGVGQTWGVERYHPATHSFTPAPIMDKKRAHASALELEDGRIVISGNWWTTDFTEIYCHSIEDVWADTASDNRSYPIILPMKDDNAWIIGASYESYGGTTKNIVDQVKGEPFEVALLDQWHPRSPLDRNVQADAYRVGENAFLIPAANKDGQFAPMLVDGNGFSLLPMEQALPSESPWGAIKYSGSFWTSPETETAWLMGVDKQHWNRVYLAEIHYQPALQGGQATLCMHYSQPLEQLPINPWEMLLPDGSFVTAGGLNSNNYNSCAAVFAFYPKAQPESYSALFFIGIGLLFMAGLGLAFVLRRRKRQETDSPLPSAKEVQTNEKTELGDKLKAVMEEQQLFRNKNLLIADVSAKLGTNTTYISAYLNGELNTTFPAFVMGYRIRYAQELMRNNPTMRMAQVAAESGFANEKTFLRNFKTVCGVTPSEWKQEHTPQTED